MQLRTEDKNLVFSELIGKGGFASVFLAKDTLTNKKYALKKIATSNMSPLEFRLFETEKKF